MQVSVLKDSAAVLNPFLSHVSHLREQFEQKFVQNGSLVISQQPKKKFGDTELERAIREDKENRMDSLN